MKLRKLGIRIVYKVVDGAIEVTEIVAIGDMEDEEVYHEDLKNNTCRILCKM